VGKRKEQGKMARARRAPTAKAEKFTCPECGRTFSRAAALGAHRRQAHGIAGAKSQSGGKTSRSARTSSGTRATTQRRRRTAKTTSARAPAGGRSAAAPRARARADGTVDRDALLKALFPNGIPAKESVIRALNGWLDEAERLTHMR
jgi:hypothetical protein